MAKNQDLKEVLKIKGQEWTTLLDTEDFIGLAKMYSTDAKFMCPGQKTITGRKDIINLLESGSRKEDYATEYHIEEILGKYGDEYVTVSGRFTLLNGETGKDVVLYRFIDGDYVIQIDIWNKD